MRRLSALTIAALLCAACSPAPGDLGDLRQMIADVEARPQGRIEPLPVLRRPEAPVFDPAGPPSPFAPATLSELPNLDAALEARLERRPEYLERFRLSDIALLRTTVEGELRAAYVRDGDGAVHRVLPGNHLGTDRGRITSIDDGRLRMRERVRDETGRWEERDRTLSVTAP